MAAQSITETLTAETATTVANDPDLTIDKISRQRNALISRHSQALSKLMVEREDLRGVHALADFVDDSLRWTA